MFDLYWEFGIVSIDKKEKSEIHFISTIPDTRRAEIKIVQKVYKPNGDIIRIYYTHYIVNMGEIRGPNSIDVLNFC